MKRTLQLLKEYGCDIDGALPRTLNDENFLLRCIDMALDGPEFDQLGFAIKEKNVTKAFENAHTLKGVLGNVGLTPLYSRVVSIVEPLRAGHIEHVNVDYDILMKEKEEISSIVKNSEKS